MVRSVPMSFPDPSKREINVKIVYYGPPGASLAENLRYIHGSSGPAVSELSAHTAGSEQFLFFSFVPEALGEIRGFKIRLHLFTAVGQSLSPAAHRTLFKGVDGVVFVADGTPTGKTATQQAWQRMQQHLQELGYDPDQVPLVVQLDRRDQPAALPAAELKQLLGLGSQPIVEANAPRGDGVFDSLKSIARLILLEIKKMSA